MTKSIVRSVVAAMAVALSGVASAQSTQAVEWKVSDGGNGHWYQAIPAQNYFLWSSANDIALAKGAHLVTITNSAEGNFVRNLINSTAGVVRVLAGTTVGPWIGAVKDPVTLQFQWCTGEAWGYTEWAGGEPTGASWEDRICYYGGSLRWNDRPGEYSGNTATPSCVIEWDADCNGDGIVDYGQIRRGELPDFNGNNIPDCCEHGEVCQTGRYPVEWRTSEGGNGHWYQVLAVNPSEPPAWHFARAESLGGHAATIHSMAENVVCFMVSNGTGSLIGVLKQSGNNAGGWVTGEPWSFTNWHPGEGANSWERYAALPSAWNGAWLDTDTTPRNFSLAEWSADCDGDGEVDYGQILRGEIADLNGNGVPDVCEQNLLVPAQYLTIQAAIDAATSTRNVILVSEGTYNEAIDFKGKAVTVKAVGARANTIIDGTGKTTSVVRAVTSETSATLLEGFTVRNGPVGSERNSLRLGGGMYIANASPMVRNCAFVNNAAGYGGGLYGLYSNALLENCIFRQNQASSDGGGLQFFGGSPVIRNCVISDNVCTYRGGGVHLVQYQAGFPTLEDCTATGNRSQVAEGGGVSVVPDVAAGVKCVVTDCTITGNASQGRGGGLHAPVNTVGAPQASVVLANNTICGNTSAVSKRENTWLLFEDGGNAICDCFSDVDGNGHVNTGDLGFALLFVGEVTDPDFIQPDQDMNGLVDTGDIALLLLNFGSCD